MLAEPVDTKVASELYTYFGRAALGGKVRLGVFFLKGGLVFELHCWRRRLRDLVIFFFFPDASVFRTTSVRMYTCLFALYGGGKRSFV